jgi:ABC-type Fe3+/spermidine/putrescine transport system ATPase subunit
MSVNFKTTYERTSMSNSLEVRSISKNYGATRALDRVSFDVQRAEVVAVLGPSGCGKSTLLNLIAGLESTDEGEIRWNQKTLEDIPVHQRGFGLMFQDFALFPHYNVFDNIAFGLKMARLPIEPTKARVSEVLELVGLPGFEKRDVNTLSGGESQRIALARALAPHPSLLMLDEPLGSLDRSLRERLVFDLRDILEKSKQTAIYVTHDQEEAFVIADRVIIMNAGRIAQIGTPQQIYRQPSCRFVASFLGLGNQVAGQIDQRESHSIVKTEIGDFSISHGEQTGEVTVLLRPDSVELGERGEQQLTGNVEEVTFRGSASKVSLFIAGHHFSFNFPSNTDLPAKGERVTISFNPKEAIQIFPEECLEE